MSTTAPVSGFRLQSEYVVDGLVHKFHNYLDATLSAGVYSSVPNSGFSPAIVSSLSEDLFGFMAPLFDATKTVFSGYVLQQYVSGAYVPVESAASAVSASGGSAYQVAYRFTVFERGADYSIVRPTLFEAIFPGTFKYTNHASLPTAWKNFIDAYVSPANSGQMGAWVKSKKGSRPASWTSLVGMLDRKTRKRRGIL